MGWFTLYRGKARGAPRVVLAGMTREETQIARMAFPVFASGISPLNAKDQLGVFVYRCAIECGGVLVELSDIVFGDADGVVVIPQDVAAKADNAALKRTEAEHLTEEELKKGTLLRETWGAVIDIATTLDL